MEHPNPPDGGIEVIFDAALRTHASLQTGITAIESFARNPGTPLVAPLDDWSREEGRFSYATDAPVSLAEVLAVQRARGEACGVPAAVALMDGVVTALLAVQPGARSVNLRAHGNLNPWRIALHTDGTPVLLGYGLPDVELFAYLDEEQPGVSIDTLRYAPPERLDDQEEDARSDLYTLAVVGAEMMLGRPVFDGTPTSVAERVIKGDAPELIEALGAKLGDAVLDLLCVATEPVRDERFASYEEFRRQARMLQGSGPALAELVRRTLASRAEHPADEPEPPAKAASTSEEDRTLVPAVPPLPHDPDIDTIRGHARAIVDRAARLTEQALAMKGIAEQRGEGTPSVRPLLRRLSDAVARAQKASSSTTSTARLVELDDVVADALITLEMVRSAEALCEGATRNALDVLDAIQSELDEARAESELLERARRQAEAAAQRAEAAAQQAGEAAGALEEALLDGTLDVDGARERIGNATARAEAARTLARRARSAHQTSIRQARGADAMRDAENARALADEVDAAVAVISRIRKDLEESQQVAREELGTALRSGVARAQSRALEARQSLERAIQATAQANLPALDVQIQALERLAEASGQAADRCGSEAQAVLDTPSTRAALEATLASVQLAAELAATQADEASALSDRIISRAGEAARQAAAISKLRTEAEALLQRVDATREEVAATWKALQQDTEEVTGRIARDAVQVAQRAAQKVDELGRETRSKGAGIEHSEDLGFLEDRLQALRQAAEDMEERARKATSRCREARGAASRELEEIAERHREERELQQTIDEASRLAAACATAVETAWSTYHETSGVLAAAGIEGLDAQRVRAYEIIDIAEFQSGEALSAAKAAAEQTDIHEARSHMSTAASFEERIREDLPEAIGILQRIRTTASAEIEALETARKSIADALDAARDAVRAIEEMRVSGSEAARDWTADPSVATQLDRLAELADGLDGPVDVIRSCDEAARGADHAESAKAKVPIALDALRGLRATRQKVEAVHIALDAAVRTAREEIETRDNANRAVHSALDTIRNLELDLSERSQRLFLAIEQHMAAGEAVRKTRKRMRKAVDVIGEAHDLVARAARTIGEAPTAASARKLQLKVEEQLARVEEALEVATEAEAQGVRAAEQEATDRVEAEQRRLSHARSSALSHLNTAKAAAAKSVALMKESRDELTDQEEPAVRDLHDQARAMVRRARAAATGALGAARRCLRAPTADEAMTFEAEVAGLAADSHDAVLQAKGLLQEAMDLARRQEEEAQALTNIKAEITNIVQTIQEGVRRAQGFASQVVEVTAGSSDPETLATVGEAEDLLGSVKLSQTKIRAAAPMALDAQSVEVAQGLLNTCRLALERTESGIDALRSLVQRAQALLSEEAERAANRLSEARKQAERPAQEARAVAEKARNWVAAGERAADGVEGDAVLEALTVLSQEAGRVESAARQAEEAAKPAREAESVEAAEAIAVRVAASAEEAREAATRTKAALEQVKQKVDAAARLDRDAQEHRLRAAEGAAAAELCVTDAAGIAEALEKVISESGIADDEVATAFREVKRTAKAITTEAARAFELTTTAVDLATLGEVAQASDEVDAKRKEAERLLIEIRKQDRTCRELLESVKRRSRDEAKRSQDEALRARLRRKRNESTAMKREELRKQFMAERDAPSEKPNLSELRERLRSRKRPAPPSRNGEGPAPRRLGDRPRRKRPSGDGPSRMPGDGRSRLRADGASRLRADGASRLRADSNTRSGRTPDSSTHMLPEDASRDDALNAEALPRRRSAEEREASRRRRLERRRTTDHSEAIPRLPTSRRPDSRAPEENDHEHTQVGILAPEDLQEASEGPQADPRQGADALLRRLRRRRDE